MRHALGNRTNCLQLGSYSQDILRVFDAEGGLLSASEFCTEHNADVWSAFFMCMAEELLCTICEAAHLGCCLPPGKHCWQQPVLHMLSCSMRCPVTGKRLAFIDSGALSQLLQHIETGNALLDSCCRSGRSHALTLADGIASPATPHHHLPAFLPLACMCRRASLVSRLSSLRAHLLQVFHPGTACAPAGWLLRMATNERSMEEFQAVHNIILETLRVGRSFHWPALLHSMSSQCTWHVTSQACTWAARITFSDRRWGRPEGVMQIVGLGSIASRI